ncbi:hypothetical protein CASFOL_015831 [Castilleja foliolosa]|uniref:F-box domain-containing protein n=1 Tax=Castilleja foliolosa TaxID=1961234 RepID=A0ABD3DFG7_9LAMI
MGCEFQIPEPLIQHIQSFLTRKEAAQTTVLSKSWHSAWLTRPNLEFNEADFSRKRSYYDDDRFNYVFSDFAKKTIQRYEESNRSIERLSLHIKTRSPSMVDFASELIMRALKIGVTHLSCDYPKLKGLILPSEVDDCFREFVLPKEVFGAENLVELSLIGCEIGINSMKCLSLKSLSLKEAGIESIYNIISSCPLIQKLSLTYIYGTHEAWPTTVLPKLSELRCLVLCDVRFGTLWCLGDLLPMFPSLQDLTLIHCVDVREVCSPSLERITFKPSNFGSRVEFDIPSIDKFTFEGSIIPSVCFKSTSSKYWESHVSIKCEYDRAHLSTSWFLELNQLLTELSQSKIYLSLHVKSKYSFDYEVGGFEGLPKPQVENVTVNMYCLPSLSCYALFDGLFRICRPRFITLDLLPQWHDDNLHEWNDYAKKNNDFICKTLVQAMKRTCSFQILCMNGLHDLEEVNVKLYDKDVPAWRPLPLESLLDASKSLTKRQKIRFQLKSNL